MIDRDLYLLGLLGAYSAVALHGPELASRIVAAADVKNKDVIPGGRIVSDPAFKSLLDEAGINPDGVFYPPIDAKPGEYTLNDAVEWAGGAARRSLAGFLAPGKGTDRGAVEVELVNGFVDDLFPLVSDEGGEWSYTLGPAEKVLHDLLNEEYPEIEDMDPEQLLYFIERLLEMEAESES